MRNIELNGSIRVLAMDCAVELTAEAIRQNDDTDFMERPEVTTSYLEAVYDKVVELISKEG